MVRAVSLCALTVSTLVAAGCKTSFLAHWSEKKTLNGFAAAVAAEDAAEARALASSEFSTSVLASDNALDEVKRVWPVTGELEILRVADVEEAERQDPAIPEKMVTVKDERGWETDYRLIQDPEKERWVVDEILITSEQRGVSVTKSVSEQIAFAMVVSDFAEAWREGDREQRLAHLTPACRAELEALPDEVLNHVAARMFPPEERTVSTEETMDEDIAIVRLRHPTGMVLLQMKRIEGTWLIDDAAYEGGQEGETIPSLRRTAVAYAAATEFLSAYRAADLEALKRVTVKSFFNSTLSVADLKDIALPGVESATSGQLRVVGGTGELVIDSGPKTFKIGLVQTNDEENVTESTEFRVEDVTIYEQNGQVKKHLAAALVAEPTAKLFTDALIERDLNSIKALATHDFSHQVWDRLGSELMPELPLDEFQQGERELLSIIHKGATTEVTMLQAGRAMTVVLHDEAGKVKVDDVLVAVAKRPSSVKTTLAQYLPVARLTHALKAGNLEEIRKYCTNNFNRSIWSQVREIPPGAQQAIPFLDAPLASLQSSETEATVHLGQPDHGGMITMLKFESQWKVNEITLITGPDPGDRVALKGTLRDHLANGTLYADADEVPVPKTAIAEPGIQPVGYEQPAMEEGGQDREEKEPRPFDLGQDVDPAAEVEPLPGSTPSDDAPKRFAPEQGEELPQADTEIATPVKPSAAEDVTDSADSPAAPFDAPLWE